MKFYLYITMLSTVLLLGCSSSSKQYKQHYDPLEQFNRIMYNFNYEVIDPYLIRPVAITWCNYMPQPIRNRLKNFTSNLEEPAIMVNYFLQCNPYLGMIHFTRFFLNCIFGVGGFIDVAEMSNDKLKNEYPQRFGSTLGHYGVGYGPYVYLPFYGSFTVRDDIGNIIDTFYPILSWLTWPLSISKWILEGIEARSQFLNSDILLHQSLDPYIVIREIYFQRHDFITHHGKLKQENQNIKIIENELSDIDLW